MADGKVKVVIQAVDNATATIKRINATLQNATRPVRQLGQATKALANTAGITQLGSALGSLGNVARTAASSIVSIAAPLGVLTGAASIAGVARLATAWGEMGTRIQSTASRVGIGVASLSTLRGAAELAGASAGDLDSGIKGLRDNLQDAAFGRNNELLNLMGKLGISFRDAEGNVKPVDQLLPQIAEKLSRIEDPAVRARVATQLFGGAGEALLPMLGRGAEGLRRLTEEARRNGVVTAESAAKADQLRQSQTSLMQAVTSVGNSISEALTPVLIPMMAGLRDWLNANREIIATRVTDFVREFARWIQSINWTEVGNGIKTITGAIKGLVVSVDGFLGGDGSGTRAIGAFLGLWAASKVGLVSAGISTIAASVRLLSTAGTALMGSGLMAGFVPWLTGVGVALLPILGPLAAIGGAILALSQLNPITPREEGEARRGTLGGENGAHRAEGYYGGSSRSTISPAEADLMDRLIRDGYTPEQAAGVTGNFRHEGGRWNAVIMKGGGNGARGGFQWRGGRQQAFARWYSENNGGAPAPQLNDATPEVQYRWLRRELETSERAADADLRQSRSAMDAGVSFGQGFERYGDRTTPEGRRAAQREDAARGQSSEDILRAYRARQPAPNAPAAPGAAGTPSAAGTPGRPGVAALPSPPPPAPVAPLPGTPAGVVRANEPAQIPAREQRASAEVVLRWEGNPPPEVTARVTRQRGTVATVEPRRAPSFAMS